MKKKVNKEYYKKLIYSMQECGISLPIMEIAKKMDIDLPMLFYEKLIINKDYIYKEQLSRNLLGVYGNFIASNYFKGLGYEVENEVPVYDQNCNEITRADLCFTDKNGIKNFCEVKTTTQIIDNIRNYIDDEEFSIKGSYEDKDNEIIKYKNIGKKLLKQVDKLKQGNSVVNVIVFKGCYIDSIITSELKKQGINIIYLACNIKDLEKYVENIVDDVDYLINDKSIKKPLVA